MTTTAEADPAATAVQQRWRLSPHGTRAHLVRPDQASLCGVVNTDTAWRDPEPDTPRCSACATLADAITQRDVTDTGMTYRQLDYWTRQGYLHCDNPTPGSGTRRTWPAEQLAVASVMAVLVAAGLTVEAAHHAARNDGWLTDEVHVTIHRDTE